MAQIWEWDACSCIIEYMNGGQEPQYFIRAIKKCKLHNNLDGSALAITVLKHHRDINWSLGNIHITKQEIYNLIQLRKEAKKTSNMD